MRQRKFKSVSMVLILVFSIMVNTFSLNLHEVKAYTIAQKSGSNLKVGNTYHGFKLVEEKNLKDIKGVARVFQHEKSGAKLFNLDNKDPNKYFSIGFRTPAFNDKGAAHILEHCVLVGGSKKYPVKQLLKEVMESSVSKDLNGLTTPDTTIYPFSSTNEKEFNNIMDIYLDMVFNPSFYDNNNIFKEEGWYYDLDKENDNLKYNGVVYNEMKGALSSPTEYIYRSICKSLYPKTIYAHNSGGDPKKITELSFEELKDFHKRYYHPSNSYTFLYGDINILEKLEFLDKSYFNKYNKTEVKSAIEEEKPFCERRNDIFNYPISKEEKVGGKSFLTYNFAINDKAKDVDLGISILNDMLLSNPNSPLIKNLKKYGFNNISGSYVTQQKQPFFTIIASNTEENRMTEFKNIVNNTLEDIYNKGLNKDLIKTTLNKVNINSRFNSSYGSNSGANYNHMILSKWIYDESPMNVFTDEKDYMKILTAPKTRYFEELINKHLIQNKHSSTMLLKPEKGLIEREKLIEKEKLNELKKSLSKEELQKLIKETKELKTWINTPSDNKDLEKIPRLKLKDVEPKVELMSLNRKRENGVPVLYHPFNTEDTSLLNLYFNTEAVKEEQIPYIQLLTTLVGNIPTDKYKASELYNKERKYTTGIKYGTNMFVSAKDSNKIRPQFAISALTISEDTGKTLDLIKEEIQNSKITNKNILKVALKSIEDSLEQETYLSPHMLALNRNLAQISKGECYKEKLKGITYIEFIKDLNKNFDKKYDFICKNLDEVRDTIVNRNNLTVSITTNNNGYKIFQNEFESFTKDLNKEQLAKRESEFKPKGGKEAFSKNIGVLYNVQGFNFKNLNQNYNGNMLVLKNILDLDYLWPRVRVKGGAYGINTLINSKGDIGIVSYRDPNLKQTLNVYRGIPEYIKNLNLTEKELESYKISTLAPYCHTNTIEEKVHFADYMYFCDLKREDIEKELKEIKNTKLKDIKSYEKLFREGLKESNITVIGNKSEIEKEREIFNNIDDI
ncbi:insulinase family protein [Hathewaya histolytica]|uniref:insulinase family protein n=1 Tax=Hathewaya histolytica TaxID=1498 RepID=UPI003B6856A2